MKMLFGKTRKANRELVLLSKENLRKVKGGTSVIKMCGRNMQGGDEITGG